MESPDGAVVRVVWLVCWAPVLLGCGERPFEEPEVDCTPCPGSEGMACVECGPFLYGDADGEPDDAPELTVYLDTFEMDVNEVTQEHYLSCANAGACPDCKSSPWPVARAWA